ncbi:MAG: transglycosylase domain-containing protein [Myxococcota bacterium]|nr:transglycosylase domain-containing protein [Myxococcota bacterium]
MSKKYIFIAIIVVALIVAAIVTLLFQVGADEQIIANVLPRLEQRLGVDVEYRDASASLTGVVMTSVEMRSNAGRGVFARVDRVGITVRIGPLFWGKVDVTDIRLDGLSIPMGVGTGGVPLSDWHALFSRVLGVKTRAATSKKRSFPEISVGSASLAYDDGRFLGAITGISGQIGGEARAAFEADLVRLKHGTSSLIEGSHLELFHNPSNKEISIHLSKPSFQISITGESLMGLYKDAQSTGAELNDFFNKIAGVKGDRKEVGGNGNRRQILVNVTKATGAFVTKKSDEEDVKVDNVAVNVSKRIGDPIFIRAGGEWHRMDARWTIDGEVSREGSATLKIDVPDMPLSKSGALLLGSKYFKWQNAYADSSLVATLIPKRQEASLSGHISVTGIAIDHPRLASAPTEPLDLQGDFKISLYQNEKRIHLDRFLIARNLARATIRGDIWLDRFALDISVNVPPTSCQQVLAAMPKVLVPRIEGARLDGRIGMSLRLALDDTTPDEAELEAELDNTCRIETFGAVPAPDYLRGPFSYVAYTAEGEDLRLLSGPGTDRWVPLPQISPFVIEAVLTTEDGKFWHHDGITLPEIRRAISLNLKKQNLRHGASTITMQLAKNLFLTRERTIARKLQELFFVWYLESYFKKEEILELYLNVVEFGPSIYGIQDASEYYFGRQPVELNAMESVFLIKLLPSPIGRHRQYERGGPTDRMAKILGRVLKTMMDRGRLTAAEYAQALNQKLIFHKPGTPLPEPRLPVRRFIDPEQLNPAAFETLDDEEESPVSAEDTWDQTPD